MLSKETNHPLSKQLKKLFRDNNIRYQINHNELTTFQCWFPALHITFSGNYIYTRHVDSFKYIIGIPTSNLHTWLVKMVSYRLLNYNHINKLMFNP